MANFIVGGFSPDGEQIVFTRDEPLATPLFVYDIKTRSTRQLMHGKDFTSFAAPSASGRHA